MRIDDATASPGALAAVLSAREAVPTADAGALTERTAAGANADYEALVSGFVADPESLEVHAITKRSLNSAVGGVADTIAGIGADAGAGEGRGAGPSASALSSVWPFAVWCLAGMALGVLLIAALVVVALLRKRSAGLR